MFNSPSIVLKINLGQGTPVVTADCLRIKKTNCLHIISACIQSTDAITFKHDQKAQFEKKKKDTRP